ncbi:Lipid A core - O-antigen ligase [Hyphomicrobium sulfonivorans]|uniref:Lipid A core-O-antigen ligase n=1 Tax=Hyphomicrobium sulfonivorans TaxID=121290 RepID=A0A109B8J5_HYPSL|nr:O-antigen ligase family protein [Hyphomicrobium sulfonivorans]KWT64148.1 Lipid A core - O-antigen ligase [Hyphomicrobium sulfonivorans]
MFSNETGGVGLGQRCRGIALGTLLMVAVVAALISPRTLAVTFWIVALGFLVSAFLRRDIDMQQFRPGPVTATLALFVGYVFLSATWADVPAMPLEKAVLAAGTVAAVWMMCALIRQETRANIIHMGEGVFLGVVIGTLFLLEEHLSQQAIKIAVFNSLGFQPGQLKPVEYFYWDKGALIEIEPNDLVRNLTGVGVYLWPAIAAVLGVWRRPMNFYAAVALFVIAAAAIMISNHAASQLALIAGVIVFAIASRSLLWARRCVAAGWLIACFAVIPLALGAYKANLQQIDALGSSVQARLIIWKFTAEKTFENPWFGVGANMTRVIGPELEKTAVIVGNDRWPHRLSIHAHNMYLQTWFELGAVGAVLLAAIGLAILSAIARLDRRVQRYALATFALTAAVLTSSYGMWQVWLIGTLGVAAVAMCIGVRALETSSPASADLT